MQNINADTLETDAAIAAADLVQKLEKGFYMLPDGNRRRINNDARKLLFAVGLGDLQRKLLMDFRFRCSAIPVPRRFARKLGTWVSGLASVTAAASSAPYHQAKDTTT